MSKKAVALVAVLMLITFSGTAALFAAEGQGQSVQCGAISDGNGCPSPTFTCTDVCGSYWVIDSMVCSGNNSLCYGHPR
jgi:hypothetical protein